MIYLDTCAIVKLVHVEPQTAALRAWMTARGSTPLVSSLLARVETARALRRTDPAALANVPLVLGAINLVAIDESVCAAAAAYEDPLLRSLDAIHLATAAVIGSALTSFVTYDKRLASAATAAGLPVAAPH
jgi:uncharacterized protein